ncbi:NosL [Ramlibacter tataouinensis]|uniref:NosL n=1 Tax=Ramlibacter tataouinensis TaxID=94132 RepID=A0A127JZ89_9BURK|nr:NosL [Ramlibacter tataouinensis]
MEVQVKRRVAGMALFRWTGIVLLATVAACSSRVEQAKPQEITKETVCALDGMLLAEHPGPKGQIHYDQGAPDFYCDTKEVLAMVLRPEQRRRVTGVFVQDMGKADWNQPSGHWIDAKGALYVLGSRRNGSMGPTVATFGREEDAQQFVKQYGGKVLRFQEITPDMVALDGGVVRDQRM